MSDHDEFEEIFRDFWGFVGPASVSNPIDGSALACLPQLEGIDEDIEDEVILGDDDVTYLLHAEGNLQDTSVLVGEEEMEVRTPKFSVKRPLEVRVDPSGVKTSYNNGVLAASVKRRMK